MRSGIRKQMGNVPVIILFHMSVVEWNEETEREIQDMINEGITSFKLLHDLSGNDRR